MISSINPLSISRPSIDDEWQMFMSGNSAHDIGFGGNIMEETNGENEYNGDETNHIELHNNTADPTSNEYIKNLYNTPRENLPENIPHSTEIYISTKTKIAYLNTDFDLMDIFWKMPVIDYYRPLEGIIKKQIKINCTEREEFDAVQEKIKEISTYYEEQVIRHIDNPTGRIKFKDIRKISIGISKKDIMSVRSKKKSAFYNCFVVNLRLYIDNCFKEFHVKIFNTGKLEIPGVQNDHHFLQILERMIHILQPFVGDKSLKYKENSAETVLINSNFNCGYYIHREILYEILKNKYNIMAIYDPCSSYPGIQCKFYYDHQNNIQVENNKKSVSDKTNNEVSFMIFRTGSVLIVGKCDVEVLYKIYDFLRQVFIDEFAYIFQCANEDEPMDKKKDRKVRKRMITLQNGDAMA